MVNIRNFLIFLQNLVIFIRGPLCRLLYYYRYHAVVAIAFIFMCFHPSLRNEYTFIPFTMDEIYKCPDFEKINSSMNYPICDFTNTAISSHKVLTVVNNNSLNGMAERLGIKPGGKWSPPNCYPLQTVAIIVPYRNRNEHLLLFLQNMHPFLQAQKLSYIIVVVEQADKKEFNRGALLNIGFKEIIKNTGYCCFIFHDVDLLPETLDNFYGCLKRPRHFCSAINEFRYILPYGGLFGGVVSFTKSQFQVINGYSNLYFGWGGEDDDLYDRVIRMGLTTCRLNKQRSRYTMLTHSKAFANPLRFTLLAHGRERLYEDGLNSMQYEVEKKIDEPLYTRYIVHLM